MGSPMCMALLIDKSPEQHLSGTPAAALLQKTGLQRMVKRGVTSPVLTQAVA